MRGNEKVAAEVTLPPGIILPKGYLSVSQIETYLKCGIQYYFRYIEGLISPPSIELGTGKAGHAALELNFTHKAVNGADAPLDEVLDHFSDRFEAEMQDVSSQNATYKGAVKDKTTKLIEIHQDKVAPNLVPASPDDIEGKIEMPIAGIPMVGYYDLATQSTVIDHKFVSRTKSKADADNSLQLTFYARATGKKDVAFNCLIKSNKRDSGTWSEPRVNIVSGNPRNAQDFQWLESVVRYVANAISAGIFLPAPPDHWACTKKWCGYYHKCRGAGKDVSPKIIQMSGTRDVKLPADTKQQKPVLGGPVTTKIHEVNS